jgi:hypothetical protein
LGALGRWDSDQQLFDGPLDVLFGEVDATPVSLLDVSVGAFKYLRGGPPHETEYAAGWAVFGGHLDGQTTFRRARVRIQNLNEWANRRTWAFDHPDPQTDTITYTLPSRLEAKIDTASVRLVRDLVTTYDHVSKAQMNSNEWIDFEFAVPLTLADIQHYYVRPARQLMELATASASAILEFRALPKGWADAGPDVALLLNESRRPASEPLRRVQMLFGLSDVDFATLMPAWYALHEQQAIVVDSLTSWGAREYVSSRFFTLASAAEGYHRRRWRTTKATAAHRHRIAGIVAAAPTHEQGWLKDKLAHSHEPTFDERLKSTIEHAGPLFAEAVGDAAAWRRWVVGARNSVAHRTPRMRVDVEAEWLTAARVSETLSWLLLLALLRDLEIPDDGVRIHGGLKIASLDLRGVRPDWFQGRPPDWLR